MTRLIFPTRGGYLATTLDLLLIKVLSADRGYGLRRMAYLHIMLSIMITYLQTPTVRWYQ